MTPESNEKPFSSTPNEDSHLENVYQDLRNLAENYLNRQPPGHTLQPTALVHEAYLRLAKQQNNAGLDSGHFFAMSVKAMRSVLVDHARHRNRLKRGGDLSRIPLDDIVDLYQKSAVDLVALDEALTQLALSSEDQAKVVELRFFGGLTEEETAAILGVSTRTVTRLWRRARAWLRHELSEGEDHDP